MIELNLKSILNRIISTVNNIDTDLIFSQFSFAKEYSKDLYLYFYEDFLSKFSIDVEKLKYSSTNYFIIKKDFDNEDIYSKGYSLKNIFTIKSVGIKTHKDKIAIDYTEKELLDKLNNYFTYLKEEDVHSKYKN